MAALDRLKRRRPRRRARRQRIPVIRELKLACSTIMHLPKYLLEIKKAPRRSGTKGLRGTTLLAAPGRAGQAALVRANGRSPSLTTPHPGGKPWNGFTSEVCP